MIHFTETYPREGDSITSVGMYFYGRASDCKEGMHLHFPLSSLNSRDVQFFRQRTRERKYVRRFSGGVLAMLRLLANSSTSRMF